MHPTSFPQRLLADREPLTPSVRHAAGLGAKGNEVSLIHRQHRKVLATPKAMVEEVEEEAKSELPVCNGSDRSCLSESEQTCLRCDSVKPLRLY